MSTIKSPIMGYFVAAINYARKMKDLGQADVAKLAEMTPQALSRIIKGGRTPKVETQERIAEALGYSLKEFIELGRKLSTDENPKNNMDDSKSEEVNELLRQIANMSRSLIQKDEKIDRLEKEKAEMKKQLDEAWSIPTASDMEIVTSMSDEDD